MVFPKTNPSLKVISPSNIDKFACTGCGGCCKLWAVSIDEVSFERTKAFLENTNAVRPHPDRPWYFEKDGVKYYELTEEGNCVFLDKDRSCFLHRHDPSIKSRVCRDYPRGGELTPRGYELSMTFSSYGAFLRVLADAEPFSVIEEESDLIRAEPLTDGPAVAFPKSFSWETYFIVEKILLDHVNGSPDLDAALIESSRFLERVEREADGPELREKIESQVLRPGPDPGTQSVSNIEGGYRLMEKIMGLRKTFLNGISMLDQARVEIENFQEEITRAPGEDRVGAALFYSRLKKTWYDPSRTAIDPLLKKFLLYKIFQKNLFTQFGFVRGFNVLCFLYALIRLRTMMACRKSGRAAQPLDLYDPIHFAEVQFLHSKIFMNFWKDIFQTGLLTSPKLAEILVRV